MTKAKERKHRIKQANTLETSKKTLQKATLSALRNGGFLFSRDDAGYFIPVFVNARILDIVASVIPFAVSRTRTVTDLMELKSYISGALDQVCDLRKKDIETHMAPEGRQSADPAAVAAIIEEAEKSLRGTGSEG